MVNMMSKSGGINTISSLLQIMADPAKVQKHIDSIREAEAAHEAKVKKNQVDLASQFAKLKADQGALNDAAAKLAKREESVVAREEDAKRREQEHQQRVEGFNDASAKTSKDLQERAVALATAKADHEKKAKEKVSDLAKRESELVMKEKDVATKSIKVNERESAVKVREDAVSAREKRLREAIGGN